MDAFLGRSLGVSVGMVGTRRTFVSRIATFSSATQDDAISCVRALNEVSDIFDSSFVETSWSFFRGKWDGMGKAIFTSWTVVAYQPVSTK